MAASAYPSASKRTLSGRAPSPRRSSGSCSTQTGAACTTSSSCCEVKSGSCHTIQSERGPVSPSGIRRRRSPSAPATVRKTRSGLASGMLPTRWTPRAKLRGASDTLPHYTRRVHVDAAALTLRTETPIESPHSTSARVGPTAALHHAGRTPMTQVTRRDLLKGAAALGVAGAVAPLAGPVAAQTTQKKELVVAQGGDVAFFDPHMSTSANDIRISFNLFDNLVSRHPDQKLYPGLATEWKLEGQTAWRFKLRPGVKWHNGDPFTSADVKFSLERTFDPAAKTRVSTVFTTIDRIETPDPMTAVIHTKKPDPNLPGRLAFYGGQIVPKKYLETVGAETFNQKPVGTGPVRFVSWTKDDKAVLEANPDYWGGKSDFDRMVFRAIPETAPRIASLLKGEVDVITQLPPDHGERV